MKTPNKSRLLLAGLTASALVFASCGGGGSSSIVDSGNTEAPATDNSGEPTAAPTTVTTPLASLPPCDTTALDSVTETVDITFWHGMNGDLEDALTSLTAEYNASQTKVKVSLENQGGYEQTLDKYLQSSQDSRPEMVQAPEYAVQVMGDTDSNVPVGACIESAAYDTSDFLPKALNQYFTEGVQCQCRSTFQIPCCTTTKRYLKLLASTPTSHRPTWPKCAQCRKQLLTVVLPALDWH
jgi:ABC-type glycerol-3-phosphate transport system substrate-binding protein